MLFLTLFFSYNLINIRAADDNFYKSDKVFTKAAALADTEEFVGPFSNWANVKTVYGAVGNGIADDSAALQRAFDEVGNSGRSKTIYLPAGTYRITRSLTISARQNVNILGENPENTIIKWDGANDAVMLNFSGVGFSRYGRLTLDGAGRTVTGIYDRWDGATGSYVTHNEYADITFRDMKYGLNIGQPHFGDAEVAILRCKFIRCAESGFFVGSFNSLDLWIWNSTFEDCRLGATNLGGAGHFHVYNSVFRRSTYADISVQNASYFSFRNNYSINSASFFVAEFVGANSSQITLQGNTILDTTDTPIKITNPGPVLLFDNVIRSRAGQTTPAVSMNVPLAADLIEVGNTYTVTNPVSTNARLTSLDNQTVSRSTINPPEPILPVTPPNLNRRVFEISAAGDGTEIQQAINAAQAFNGQRPVIHFPAGDHQVYQTLTIPAGSDVQLVGDGGFANNSNLSWFGGAGGTVLRLLGPSRATLRDFLVMGNYAERGNPIVVENADQPGGRVFMEQAEAFANSESNLLVNGLDDTLVELRDFYHSDFHPVGTTTGRASVKVIGGQRAIAGNPSAGRVNIFGGASSNSDSNYEVTNNGKLLAQDIWYEGSPRTFLRMSGSGTFTLHGARMAYTVDPLNPAIVFDGFRGRATILAGHSQGAISVTGAGANTKFLGAGLFFEQTSNQFSNTSTGGRAVLLNSKFRDPSTGLGTIANQGTSDAAFLREMLAQTRTEKPQPLSQLPVGVTDVRMFRVTTMQGLNGFQIIAAPKKPAQFDFDGDGKSDVSVFRPSQGVWYLQQSQNGFGAVQFGLAADKIVPADYDGDGKTDIAVYRNGLWYLNRSQAGFAVVNFGLPADIPVSADYDGDGKADIAVFRPSTGVWYRLNSSNNQFIGVPWGLNGDLPALGDFDGDGKADLSVFRPSQGIWYRLNSSNNQFTAFNWGSSGDKPVPADYDGDGKTDPAVYRNGIWYLLKSRDGFQAIQWGLASDTVTPADYDGDGKTDPAVYRSGIWHLLGSGTGITYANFGLANDLPIPSSYVP